MLKAIILGAGYRGRAYAEYATARSWGLFPPAFTTPSKVLNRVFRNTAMK